MNYEDDDLLFGKACRALNLKSAREKGASRLIPHVSIGGQEHKSCSLCGSLKPLSEFQQDRTKVGGLKSRCKSCIKS